MNQQIKIILLFFLLFCSAAFTYGQGYNLQYYLQQGQGNSPLLKDYQNQIKSGFVDSNLIRANQHPQVLANGQVLLAPTYQGYGYDKAITNGGNYMAVVSVSQPIFNKNKIAPQYRSIDLQNKAIKNKGELAGLDLKRQITAQYLTAYSFYQQLQSNKAVDQLLQTQQQILEKLVQEGVYNQSDYLNLKVTLQTQHIVVSQLAMQYQIAVDELNYICGINDTSIIQLSTPDLSIENLSQNDSSLFYRQYAIDSLTIANQKAVIDAQYKSSLSWFADAGLQSSMPSTMYRNFGASFGLNWSIPIYDGKQRKLNYQKLMIAENTRADYAFFFHKQYNQQVAMLVGQLKASEKLIAQIKDKLETSKSLIALDRQLLNTGDIQITDYLLAIQHYLSIEDNLNQVEVSRYQTINQLNYWNH